MQSRKFPVLLVVFLCAVCVWDVGVAAPPVDAPGPLRYDGQQVITVDVRNGEQLKLLFSMNLDIWACHIGIGPLDVRVTPEKKAAVRGAGFDFVVKFPDVQALVERERRFVAPRGQVFTFDAYYRYDDIIAYLSGLAAAYPALAQMVNVGTTVEGRTIWAIRITGPLQGGSKPEVLYHGAEHAREWITPPLQCYIAKYLLENYDTDPVAANWVDTIEWYMMPVMNPDGYEYTHTTDRFWRKNRRNNGGGVYGVDLNRNWGYGWGGEGTSSDPWSDIYRGPFAFSEPETQAVRDFMLAHPNLRAHIDFHSFSELILWPWGFQSDLPPDNDTFQFLGTSMQQGIFDVHGHLYVAGPIYSTIYPASGVSVDWAYGQQGIWSFAFELRDTGEYGFLLPPEQIIPTCEENLQAVLFLSDWVGAALRYGYPDGLPDIVAPLTATTVTVSITPVNENLVEGTATLHHRENEGESFSTSVLTPLGGDLFEGTLPPSSCNDTPQYYFSAQGDGGTTVYSPVGAPAQFYTVTVAEETFVIADTFETDLGWTAENLGAGSGFWQRGVPVDDPSWAYDPASDADGSGQCYLTQNEPGNTDVDNGAVRLTSPSIDMSAGGVIIRYDYFLRLTDSSGIDRLLVEINTNDGVGAWTEIARHDTDGGLSWRHHEIDQAALDAAGVTPTATTRIRFTANDDDPQSIVEAGIDAFAVSTLSCEIQDTPGDLDGDGDVDLADFVIFSGCFGGAGVTTPPGECGPADFAAADLDGDGDVDLADFVIFAANFTG